MGNQLSISGAAASINVQDISSSMTLMAPLGGGRRGRLFTSMHCGVMHDGLPPAGGQGAASGTQRRRARHEYVVKVFVRNAEDRLQAQLLAQHHESLIAMEKLLAVPLGKQNVAPPAAAAGVPAAPPSIAPVPLHALFYTEMDRRSERYCKLQRPFLHYSLMERLQMRPICVEEQRLFFGYQLLEAVDQLHSTFRVVHGDLKVENVLMTSHHWLYLVDFAPFKPPLLPSYNPANFEFYYDVSESRVCCAAPEKFFDITPSREAHGGGGGGGGPETTSSSSIVSPSTTMPPQSMTARGAPMPSSSVALPSGSGGPSHTAAMDVFSAACVIAQLMTDEPLFRLSGVLELRSKASYEERELFVRRLLEQRGVVSEALMAMLLPALCRPPDSRPTARQLLLDATPSVFPSYFGFLHNQVFPSVLRAPPDVQIMMLHSQWHRIMATVEQLASDDNQQLHHLQQRTHMASDEHHPPEDEDAHRHPQQHGGPSTSSHALRRARRGAATLLLPIVTTALRHLKTVEAKCQAVNILRQCVADAQPSVVREIIVPHLVHVIRHPVPSATYAPSPSAAAHGGSGEQLGGATGSGGGAAAGGGAARAEAIGALRHALDGDMALGLFQSSEALLFDDYLLPVLSEIARDGNVLVLSAVAAHLPHLLITARRFLEWRQAFYSSNSGGGGHSSGSAAAVGGGSYDAQLNALLAYGWDLLKGLYKQKHSCVVTTMLQETATVVRFLGEERAQDDLLPLLTTAMSGRMEVRRMLLRSAIEVHTQLEGPKAKTLQFFAEEGLRQPDTACLLGTIQALEVVVRGHCALPTVALLNVVLSVIPQMANPVQWVRCAACRLVEACAATFRPCDVMLHLECAVRPFLNHPVPLAMLSRFPNAVKSELAWVHMDHSQQTLGDDGGAGGGRSPPADGDGSNGQHIRMLPSTATHTSSDLMLDDYHVDVQCPRALIDYADPVSNGAVLSADWTVCFAASQRHLRRWHHRLTWEKTCGNALQQALRLRAGGKVGSGSGGGAEKSGTPSTATYQDPFANTTRSSLDQTSSSAPNTQLHRSRVSASSASASGQPVAAMRPVAVPIFSAKEHGGGIYAMDSVGGLLVTAGANGQVKTWEISPDDYTPTGHVVATTLRDLVPKDEITMASSFLTTTASGPAASSGLLLGGSGGVLRYCAVETDTIIHSGWVSHAAASPSSPVDGDGSRIASGTPPVPITSICKLHHHSLALTTSADGSLTVVDVRTKALQVWSTSVSPACGPVVAAVALGPTDANGTPTSVQHAAVAATLHGAVLLFDLRHRIEVAHYRVPKQGRGVGSPLSPRGASASAASFAPSGSAALGPPAGAGTNGHSGLAELLCIANDVLPAQSMGPVAAQGGRGNAQGHSQSTHRNLAFGSPNVFLGTRFSGLLKLDLTNGSVVQCFATSQPTEMRCLMPVPRTSLLVSGSSDRLLRLWNTSTPSASHTLCSSTTESPKVLVSSGVVEEGMPPAQGYGPWRALARKSGSNLQEHLDSRSVYRQHHTDQVTSVHALKLRSTHYLVSASRDGQLVVWHNAGF